VTPQAKGGPAFHAAIALLLAGFVGAPARADQPAVVAAIEATYLTKFAPFVAWPANASPDTRAAVELCVLDDNQIADLVEIAVSKTAVGEPAKRVRRLASSAQASGCHILFLGDGTGAALAAVSASPILTVTAEAQEGRKGIINFVIRDDRLRFEIDEAEAARRGLAISSNLLSLAVSVTPRAERGN
jgi:hypothetical protein